MNVLITGASGFVGQHLLEELKDDNLSLSVISRKKTPEFWTTNKNFKLFCADIADKSSLEPAFKGVDIVINLAAELKDDNKFKDTNIKGVQNIIDLSVANGVKKIIHLSSVGVVGMQYSSSKTDVDEKYNCTPQNGYEKTKLESELLLRRLKERSNIEINILRPTNVFGDCHPRNALLGFLKRVKENKAFPARKGAWVNYVYVKDVAHALRYCTLNNVGYSTINVGEACLFENFANTAAMLFNTRAKTKYLPALFFASMEAINYLGRESIKAKFRATSNFVAYTSGFMSGTIGYKYGLEQGLKRTIDYYTSKNML